jgi:hypothetical protein
MSSGSQPFGGGNSTGLPSMSPFRGFGSPVVQALQKPAAPQGPQTQPPATKAPLAPQTQPTASAGPMQPMGLGRPPVQNRQISDVQRQQMQQYRDYQQEQFGNWQRQQAPIYESTEIDAGITGSGGLRAAAPMSLQEMRGLWRKGAWR